MRFQHSNTSHVIIQSRYRHSRTGLRFIQIHLMLLFNIPCFPLPVSAHFIQIHLMLLFNARTCYRLAAGELIQIHLMLLFNKNNANMSVAESIFKYISCYYSIHRLGLFHLHNQIQIHLMLLFNQRFSVAFPA